MAAKPPAKPPGNFLKQLNECINSGNNTPTKILNKLSAHLIKKNNDNTDNNSNSGGSSCSGSTNSLASNSNINVNGNFNEDTTATLLHNQQSIATATPTSTPTAASVTASIQTTTASSKNKSTNCNCTNISIMHLFHEMKQEFPTIPDTIVTQCVNENCHQREKCIQKLRHELALHAIPLQTYPAKVLHPPTTTTTTTAPTPTPIPIPTTTATTQQRRIPGAYAADNLTPPLKPIRPAPVQPSLQQQQQKQNCDSVNNNCRKNSALNSSAKSPGFMRKDVNNIQNRAPISDMPVTSLNSSCSNNITSNNNNNHNNNNNNCVNETRNAYENRENVNLNEIQQQNNNTTLSSTELQTQTQMPPTITPRARPTTLNLQQQKQNQQQQQRQQINQQLQKHFQQRQQQQQQQHQKLQTKPLRKAPLPPLPPKPAQYVNAGAHSPQFHHQNSYNNNNNGNHILINSQRSSFSNDSCLTSPTSSVGESEISVNVSLSSPIVTTPPPPPPPSASAQQQQQQTAVKAALRSPIRRRSVITVHPEPPYTRDFVSASASVASSSPSTPSFSSSSGGGGGGGGAPKSFTSVNLTLRQPNANSSVPASTIDISAGPGLSGNGTGLTYSSTSYDARLGYQKNFHITVTDEGGVFSASRIRPRSCFVPEAKREHDGTNSPTAGSQVNPLRTASSEQCVSVQENQQQWQLQQQQQQEEQRLQQQNVLDILNNAGDMCLQKEYNAVIQILDRQKNRRDKLATALRDNKKRLNQVEQEINVLTEPIRPGENERLDEEIRKLRCDCEAMLNEIDISRRSGPSLANFNNRQIPQATPSQIQQQQQLQMQTQPFPRQRSLRSTSNSTAATPPPTTTTQRQPQLDFIQHHITPTTPRTPSLAASSNSPHHQHQQQPQAPPTYQEYCQQYQIRNPQQQQQQQHQQQRFIHSTDEEEYSDSVTDADDDDDYEEEPLEMWACNMCTFRNHPQLNICECCENVRILPGTLRHIGVAAAAVAAAAASSNQQTTETATATATARASSTPNATAMMQI